MHARFFLFMFTRDDVDVWFSLRMLGGLFASRGLPFRSGKGYCDIVLCRSSEIIADGNIFVGARCSASGHPVPRTYRGFCAFAVC